MGRGSVKRFKDKHGARTFKLVPKAGGSGEDRVFVEVTPGADSRRELQSLEEAFSDALQSPMIPCSDQHHQHVVGEAAKYGILYDDRDYDYTKHLKLIGDVPGAVWVQSHTQPDTEDCFEQIKELDEAVYKDIKAVVSDPNVLEVLVALEDEAYVQQDVSDDFVCELNKQECDDLVYDDILDEFSSNSDIQYSTGGILPEQQQQQQQLPVDVKKNSFAEIDELRKALLADGPLRIPSDSSEFDSDEYFAELEASDEEEEEGSIDVFGDEPTTIVRPQVISEIKLSKKTGRPIKYKDEEEEEKKASQSGTKENLGLGRDRQETAKEKKQRKSAIKASRKERRHEKKENKLVFGKSILVNE